MSPFKKDNTFCLYCISLCFLSFQFNVKELECTLVEICIHCCYCYYKIFLLKQGIPDDSDEFGEFRIRVADLIKDCVFVVGSENCFSQVL